MIEVEIVHSGPLDSLTCFLSLYHLLVDRMFRTLRLAVSLIHGSQTLETEVRYSKVSSLVTKAHIGSPPQEVSIGFDFKGNESSLFAHGEDCPAYVNRCFEPEQSTTWEATSGTDTVTIGSMEVSNVPLALLKSSDNIKFRETAGSISAGKQSKFFAGKRVVLKETKVQIVLVTTKEEAGVLKMQSTDPIKWDLQADLVQRDP